MDKKLKKNFIWNMVGSIFNAFNSLFFMIIVTRINGINDAGIFTFAFSIACMFYIIGIYSGRTFQVTDDNLEVNNGDYLYSKIITCFVMFLVSVIFCIIRQYDLYKFSIIIGLVLFKSLEAFSEGIYAVIQENNQLYKVGISLLLKGVVSLILFFIIDYFIKSLLLSILLIILVNLLIMLLYDFRNLKELKFKCGKFRFDKVWIILKKGFYAFGFAFLTQYVINAPKYSIDTHLGNDLQTIFGIIIMPATIIILLGQFVIHPFLLKLKNSFKENKKSFLRLTFQLSFVILFFGAVAVLLAYFLGIPVLEILYHIDLKGYLLHLILIIIGATCYGISLIFSTSLTTMRSTLSQALIFVVVSVFAFIISNILVLKYSVLGAAYTYVITMILLMVLYIIIFLILLKRYGGNTK